MYFVFASFNVQYYIVTESNKSSKAKLKQYLYQRYTFPFAVLAINIVKDFFQIVQQKIYTWSLKYRTKLLKHAWTFICLWLRHAIADVAN